MKNKLPYLFIRWTTGNSNFCERQICIELNALFSHNKSSEAMHSIGIQDVNLFLLTSNISGCPCIPTKKC